MIFLCSSYFIISLQRCRAQNKYILISPLPPNHDRTQWIDRKCPSQPPHCHERSLLLPVLLNISLVISVSKDVISTFKHSSNVQTVSGPSPWYLLTKLPEIKCSFSLTIGAGKGLVHYVVNVTNIGKILHSTLKCHFWSLGYLARVIICAAVQLPELQLHPLWCILPICLSLLLVYQSRGDRTLGICSSLAQYTSSFTISVIFTPPARAFQLHSLTDNYDCRSGIYLLG